MQPDLQKGVLAVRAAGLLCGLMILTAITYLMLSTFSQPSQWDLLQTEFSQAPSGTMIELENGDVFFNQYSFYAAEGRLCRIYYAGEDDLTEGLVCWDDESGWQYMLSEEGPEAVTQEDAPRLIQQHMAESQPGDSLPLHEERQALEKTNARPSS